MLRNYHRCTRVCTDVGIGLDADRSFFENALINRFREFICSGACEKCQCVFHESYDNENFRARMQRTSKQGGASGVRDDIEDGDYGPEVDYFADTNSDGSYYADSFVNYMGDGGSDYGDDLNADAVMNNSNNVNAPTQDAD